MKESLLDILRGHPNWEANIMEPATNREACIALDREMKQAAAQFVEGLLPFADSDRWQRIVEYQINEIFTDEPPHTHFNKEKRERYSLTVWNFALKVTSALKKHAFDISQLDRVTQWRLGHGSSSTHIEERLAKEEARQLCQQLNEQGLKVHYFRELCSSLYTVLAYKVEASQITQKDVPPPSAGQNGDARTNTSTLPTDLPSGILPPVLDTLKARRIFGKAIEKGYMKKNADEDKFEWIGVAKKGHNVQLAYLCGKIYGYYYNNSRNEGNQFPETELYELFGIRNLQQSLYNFYDRPAIKRQKWIDSLDELFD